MHDLLRTHPLASRDARERAERVLSNLPAGGLFHEKSWRVSPEAFPLAPGTVRRLEQLGESLWRFHRACNTLHQRSRKGSLPGWIADYTDAGKPGELLDLATAGPVLSDQPRVLRPDLILTEGGFAMTEIDSVPGGIGLTDWLHQTYGGLDPEPALVGGAEGMAQGFASIFSAPADVVISSESSDYRPEMDWLTGRLGPEWAVRDAEDYRSRSNRPAYRFYECFDWDNLPAVRDLARLAAAGKLELTAPTKPFLEEKLWLALFHSRPLRELWRRELRDSHWQRLGGVIPQGWILDPTPLPHHAVIPGLDIQDFRELGDFSQRERELVVKISGFSDLAWGSRSVAIGQDLPQTEWAATLDQALQSFPEHPYLMQRFHRGRLVHHSWWDPDSGSLQVMEGRVRLSPYYFAPFDGGRVVLGGALATICPSDKKILHGMRDAILVPCRLDENGY